jgi:hypothetical protein
MRARGWSASILSFRASTPVGSDWLRLCEGPRIRWGKHPVRHSNSSDSEHVTHPVRPLHLVCRQLPLFHPAMPASTSDSIQAFIHSGCHPGPCLCLQPFRAKPAMWMNTSTTSTYASRSKHAHSELDPHGHSDGSSQGRHTKQEQRVGRDAREGRGDRRPRCPHRAGRG